MLVLDAELPEGALLVRPSSSQQGLGGLRYSVHQCDEDRAMRLAPFPEGPVALPVEGNDAGCSVRTIGQARYLAFEANRACGYHTEKPIEMRSASIAVFFWSPDGDPRTLAALCPPEKRNYLHLTVRDGTATLGYRDEDHDLALSLGDVALRPTLLMVSAQPGTLSMGTGAGAPVSSSSAPFPEGPMVLYIGCRRFRAGLKSSLGAARISDVILYPDLDLFDPEAADIRDRLSAHLEDLRNGV